MSRITAFCEWLLRQPLVWGGMACFAFQAVVVRNLDPTSTVLADRYDEAVKAFIDAPYAPFAAEMAKNINLTSRSIAELYGQT